MAQKRESALQRIQVGVIGLVVVLLFVSLANMLMDSAIMTDNSSDRGITDAIFQEKAPDEPLAELGVTPVVEPEDQAKKNIGSGGSNAKNQPAPGGANNGQ